MQIHRENSQKNHRLSPTIVGTGLVALDVLLNCNSGPVEPALGGSTGNVLAILGHLGWHTVPVAQLGMDAAAVLIANEFNKLGADTRFLLQSQHLSTPVVYQLPGKGEHSHEFSFYCPICGRKRGFVTPTDDQAAIAWLRTIAEPDVFYFDRVTPWALELAERYRDAGKLVMFEPSTVGRDVDAFKQAVRAAHILKYADDRIADLEGVDVSSVHIEIQTHGKQGLKFRVGNQFGWHHLNAVEVPYVADTAGAGDWCTSGFLYAMVGSIFEGGGRGLLSTRRVKESLRFGQILAALNCMETGARGLARRHPPRELVKLAASIRNSLVSHIPSNALMEEETDEIFPMSSISSSEISTLLCCEAFAG